MPAQSIPPGAATPGTAAPAAAPAAELPPAPSLNEGGFSDHLRSLFEAMSTIFDRGNALTDPQHLIAGVQQLGVVWGIVFVIVGLLCLFNGYKWYRVTTIGLALLLGLLAGYILGQHIGAPFILAGCLGALCFAVAFPLLKYMVAALGGLAGAFIGANTWQAVAMGINGVVGEGSVPADAYWAGALAGLMFCGMLAFILFKLSVVLYTSVSGSTIAVFGSLALVLSIEPWQQAVVSTLTESPAVVPILVFVPAVIGLILQHASPPPAATTTGPAGTVGKAGPARPLARAA